MIEKYIKIPKKKSLKDIEYFFETKLSKKLIKFSKINDLTEKNNNLISQKTIFRPNLRDLFRLYYFILLNKRTQILEFGTGWSTLIMSIAIKENRKLYFNKIRNLRRTNPFELHVVDCNKKYMNVSKKRINNYLNNPSYVKFMHSECKAVTYNNQISNHYLKIPCMNPDFIYLDGPDQNDIKGKINGINLQHNDFMPMNCDILKIEPFLIPGTIIVTDGRGANAQFLLNNFKRNWIYKYDDLYDQHLFYLKEKEIGKLNKDLLKFYKN